MATKVPEPLSTGRDARAHSDDMRTVIRSLIALATAAGFAVAVQPGSTGAAPATPADRGAVDVRADRAIVRPATLKRTGDGYYFGAWGQSSRLVVTLVDGKLRFRDPRTARWEGLARSCTKKRVATGVAAVCRVPDTVTRAHPLTIHFEMRLGNDHVNTSTLPAEFSTSILLDAGVDEARTGAGHDFINGAFDRDLIISGAREGLGPVRRGSRPGVRRGRRGSTGRR